MKVLKIYFLLFFFFCASSAKLQQDKPNLVVAVVVDQMKYEYVDRFWNSFGENGFKKLVDKGAFCRNTHYNYMPTYTGPGHASIFTGTTPSTHGIVGNNWYSREDFSPVYCSGDWNSQTVCLCKANHVSNNIGNGQMSPNNLLCNTVGDELKLKDSLSKVFGVSIKDRGAILSTGALADGAYWLNNNAQLITSTYYRDSLPSWIVDFEKQNPASSYMTQHWKGDHFDYDLSKMVKENGSSAIKATPKGNELVFDFAKRLVEEEHLGKDEDTDLLVVSFSSTDYVGHKFGPDAEETKSTYAALDQTIADLLVYLDQQMGENNYLLMLTADHGAGTSPEIIEKNRLKGGNFNSNEVKNSLDSVLVLKYGVNDLIARYANMQFYLDFNLIDSLNLSEKEIYFTIKEVLLNEPSVKEVYNVEDLQHAFPSYETKMLMNGFHAKRSGDIFLLLNPGYIELSRKTGTSHGTHYNYDTHVPLIFYGFQIKPQQINKNLYISDIAPTLSILMKIGFPNASQGNPINDILNRN